MQEVYLPVTCSNCEGLIETARKVRQNKNAEIFLYECPQCKTKFKRTLADGDVFESLKSAPKTDDPGIELAKAQLLDAGREQKNLDVFTMLADQHIQTLDLTDLSIVSQLLDHGTKRSQIRLGISKTAVAAIAMMPKVDTALQAKRDAISKRFAESHPSVFDDCPDVEPTWEKRLTNFPAFAEMLNIKDHVTQTEVPFRLNNVQAKVAEALNNPMIDTVILVKGRRAGGTTVGKAFITYTMLRKPDMSCAFYSYNSTNAEDAGKEIRGWLTDPAMSFEGVAVAERNEDSVTSISLTNKSTVKIFTMRSSQSGSVGRRTDFAFFTEVGLVTNLRRVLADTKPSMVNGGKMFLESTSRGPYTDYAELIRENKDNPHVAIIVSYWWDLDGNSIPDERMPPDFAMTPEEAERAERFGLTPNQIYWYRNMERTLGRTRMQWDYPEVFDDAFAFPEGSVIPAEVFEQITPLKHDFTVNPWFIHKAYMQGRKYVISVDIAGGTGNDSTVVTILDVSVAGRPTFAGCYVSNKILPSAAPAIINEAVVRYPNSVIIIEANYGNAVNEFKTKYPVHEPKLWTQIDKSTTVQGQPAKPKYWHTTLESKRALLSVGRTSLYTITEDATGQDVCTALIPELPEYYLRELGSLVYNKQEHFEAAQGKHDDAVVSLFLGLYAAANPVKPREIHASVTPVRSQFGRR